MAFRLEAHRELTQITSREDTALGVMRWGENNSFPQTLKNLIYQSPNAKPAVDRATKFYRGGSFEGEDIVVHPAGITLGDVVSALAKEFAMFGGFSMQLNYNMKWKVSSMLPTSLTDWRFRSLDQLLSANKLGFHPNYGHNNNIKRTVETSPTFSSIRWVDRFNPKWAEEQAIKAGGMTKWNGQVLYYSNEGISEYPIPILQAPANYILADIENSILMRKESSTGFINSYFLKTTLPKEDPSLNAIERAIVESQGARGNGKIITLAGLTPTDVGSTLLEEIGSGSAGASAIIDSVQKAHDLARSVLVGAYLIPPILAGADQKTGFTTSELEDAYYVFNANTQSNRDTLESEINKVLAVSDFPIKEINLSKLQLDKEEDNV